MNIRIGTRGSKLALWQSQTVKELIERLIPESSVSLSVIQTKGDKILDVSLSKIGDKSLFTKEIEIEMLEGRVDVAVHSLKDLPTQLPEGLMIGAVLPRAEFRDALVSCTGKKLSELSPDDVIATSSLRRKAALLAYNPRFSIVDIRGNVDTRIAKMCNGYCDAMIMAAAGLQRLGLDSYISEILDEQIIMPAVSQGVIAIECRENDEETVAMLQKINHTPTWIAALAERSFLYEMQGGCQLPLGCMSSISNENIELSAFVSTIDGKDVLRFSTIGSIHTPEHVGKMLATLFYEAGAERILKTIKHD